MVKVRHVTDENFVTTLSEAGQDANVFVVFCSVLSGHSSLVSDMLEGLAEDNEDIIICKADAAQNVETIARLGVRTTPTVMAFRGSRLIGLRLGNQTQERLADFIAQSKALIS